MDLFLYLFPIILGVGKKDGRPGHIWGFKPPAQYNLVSLLLVILLEHFIILKMQQKRNLKSRDNFSAFAFSEILSLSHAFAC